jgi:HK97 family phage major capsid protein
MTPVEKRAKAAALKAEAHSIFLKYRDEEVGMPDEEATLYDEKLETAEKLLVEAKREERLFELETRLAPEPAKPEDRGVRTSRIEPVRGGSEGDKTRTFGDFLKQLAIQANRNSTRGELERAQERIDNLYRSEFRPWDGARSREVRDIAQSSGVTGGYLVPTDFYSQLMQVASEMSIVRPRAMVIPMNSDVIEIPVLDQTTAPSAGNTSFYGGVVGTWTGEGATQTETQPTFRQTKLTAHELTGYTEISRTVIQSSSLSLDGLIRQLFAGAVSWYEDYAFLRGNGIGKPLGIQNSPVFTASGTARGSASAISFANARQTWVKVLNQSRSRGVWLVSQAAEDAVLNMTGTANSVFIPSGYYVTGQGNAAGLPVNYALFGRPVLVSEKLPALNTAGDFGFYDFSQYLVGDRGTLEIAVSEHYKFINNQYVYRFVHHVAGRPWMNNPVTLSDASTTISPFVYLTVQ